MFQLLLIALFATLNAVVSGYYLLQAVSLPSDDPARRGSYIFAGIAGTTALLLFTLAVTTYEPA